MRQIPALAALSLALFAAAPTVHAQALGYGVNSNGALFRFLTSAPANADVVGNLGFVPEGIDFRPGTKTLYAIDVGRQITQLYTVSTTTGAATPIGAGFPTTVAGIYDLSNASTFGFDFNPRTLQTDGSIRIRFVSAAGTNLRLNSDTGLVAATDGSINFPAGGTPAVDAAAYINSGAATIGGATTLYTLDSNDDSLHTQIPPNNGTQVVVGPFGVSVDANPGISFDILSTNPGDDTLADEQAFAVLTRTGVSSGAYLLYDVNLLTGGITNGALVGTNVDPAGLDFVGGLAVTNVPEPTALTLLAPLSAIALRRRR